MKKLICIIAVLLFLSSCIIVDSRYIRMRRAMVRPVWVPYYGLFYTPYNYYGHHYWYGGYDTSFVTGDNPAVKRTVTKGQLSAPKSNKPSTKTKIKKNK